MGVNQMKSFYSIIVSLGCLISSGAYAMERRTGTLQSPRVYLEAPFEEGDLERRRALEALNNRRQREEQRQQPWQQECKAYVTHLIKGSVSSEEIRSFLEQRPTAKTQDNLACWLAVAKGIHRARQAAKIYVEHDPSSNKDIIAALGKGAVLSISFFAPIPGARLLWALRSLLVLGMTGDVMPGAQRAQVANLHENAETIKAFLKRQPTAHIPWFDKQNNHVDQMRRLIEVSNADELSRYLEEHASEPAIQANVYKLELLATTIATQKFIIASDESATASLFSAAGATAAIPLGNAHSLASIATVASNANGGALQAPSAFTMWRNYLVESPHDVTRILNAFRSLISNERIEQAQQQMEREALQRRLAQVEQEQEEAEARLEEDRAALRPLIDEAVAPLRAQLQALQEQQQTQQ